MDNDSNLKKKLVKIYKATRLKLDYMGMPFMSEDAGNTEIKKMLNTDEPFMVGRFGAVEMRCVNKWMQKKPYSQQELEQALYAAGIFPNDAETVDRFCQIYTEAMQHCDFLGVWEVVGEKAAIKKYCRKVVLAPSRAIEPYYYKNPWSSMLQGKKVLIVHPFIESIQKQLENRDKIWANPDVLPAMAKVTYVKAVQSNAGAHTEFHNWFEALEHMKKEICQKEFDIAIIGAGAYGFPLAAYVKSLGKQAIQMSGATQILFGIKGKRWDNHPVISGFYNDAWTRPLKSETPPETKKVEGGSYW